MSIVLQGSTSGSVTLQEPAVAGTTVLTLPAVSGTVLTTTSPKAGNVLQVVSTTSTTLFSSSSTSPVDITGFTVTITPTNANNKIFIIYNFVGSCANNSLSIYLNRNGTNIALGSGGTTNSSIATVPTGNGAFSYSYASSFLDSPATTSAVTYKIQANCDAGTFYIGRRAQDTLFVSPSTITVMEIAA